MSKFEIVWRALNGPRLVSEYKFHPTRRFRIDWFHEESGVAIEIEGGIFIKGGGRHNRGIGFISDCQKYNLMAERGILLFRVPTNNINEAWLSPIIQTIQRGGSLTYQKLQKEKPQ